MAATPHHPRLETPALKGEVCKSYKLETRRSPVDGSWQAWLMVEDGREYEGSGRTESAAVKSITDRVI